MGRIHIIPVQAYTRTFGGSNSWNTTSIIKNKNFDDYLDYGLNWNHSAIDLGKVYNIKSIQIKCAYINGTLGTSSYDFYYSSINSSDVSVADVNRIYDISGNISLIKGAPAVIEYKELSTIRQARWIFFIGGSGTEDIRIYELSAYIDTSLITSPFKIYDGASEISLISSPVALGNNYLNYPEPSPLTSNEKFKEGICPIVKQGLVGTPKLFTIKNTSANPFQNVVATVMTNNTEPSSDELMTICDTIGGTYGKVINYSGTLNPGGSFNLFIKTDATTASLGNHYNNINIEGTEII